MRKQLNISKHDVTSCKNAGHTALTLKAVTRMHRKFIQCSCEQTMPSLHLIKPYYTQIGQNCIQFSTKIVYNFGLSECNRVKLCILHSSTLNSSLSLLTFSCCFSRLFMPNLLYISFYRIFYFVHKMFKKKQKKTHWCFLQIIFSLIH